MPNHSENKHAQTPCKAPAKRVRRAGTPGEFGRLTAAETRFLVLIARDAFNYQQALKNIAPGSDFDSWRREQVQEETGLPGLSKINRSHVRDVAARFYDLAGDSDKALDYRLHTGTKTDHGDPHNTWETCETYVHQIREALATHAQSPVSHTKGHIHPGWLIDAARQRTGKPSLTMDTLAERLDPKTLAGLRDHLISHINLREGRSDSARRQPRRYPKKADPGSMAEDDPF